jgi:hypothetical protein
MVVLAAVVAALLAYAALSVLLISIYDPGGVGYFTRFFGYLYWLQAIVVVPWFLGDILREEMPFWMLERNHYVKSDFDFALTIYLYVIFYTQFVAITYYLFNLRYLRREFHWKEILLAGVSVWVLVAFGIFHKVISRTF